MSAIEMNDGAFGSVSNVPRLPVGFRDVFRSVRIDTGDIALHAVIGGNGPPLLLLGGWPQTWFSWRYLMLPLAERFAVIAVDPRGVGLSDKPAGGYDADTLAADMFALMDALGHERFAMVGYDVGMWTAFVMAADHPERVRRVALGEAVIPGVGDPLPLLPDDRRISDLLWHHGFNRADDINERLVEGREDLYFGYQFATKAGSPDAMPAYAKDFYVEVLRRIPGALKSSFEYYRALDVSIPLYRERAKKGLVMPVLAFSGALCAADLVEKALAPLAPDLQSVIIDECGHYPAEEQPEALLAAMLSFFSRDEDTA